jgi:hypothetical protein
MRPLQPCLEPCPEPFANTTGARQGAGQGSRQGSGQGIVPRFIVPFHTPVTPTSGARRLTETAPRRNDTRPAQNPCPARASPHDRPRPVMTLITGLPRKGQSGPDIRIGYARYALHFSANASASETYRNADRTASTDTTGSKKQSASPHGSVIKGADRLPA